MDCLGRLRYCLGAEYGENARALVGDLRDALALISSHALHGLAVELEGHVEAEDFERASEVFLRLQEEFARCRAHLPEVLARAEFE